MTRSRIVVLAVLALAAGCSKKLQSAPPAISSVAPDAFCVEQVQSTIAIAGTNFSPMESSALTSARRLELPTVSLARGKDLSGAAASGTVTLRDDPSAADQSLLTWTSQSNLSFRLPPELGLQPGLYDVSVANADGQSATSSGALLAVPPPSLTSSSQDIGCVDEAVNLVLSGDYFIDSKDAHPTVTIGALRLSPALSSCRSLPGEGGFQACTTATLTIAPAALAPGEYQVNVENPAPVGCHTATPLSFTMLPRPTVTQVQPLAICSEAQNQQLAITGKDFLTVGGVAPSIVVGAQTFASVASGCTALSGPAETMTRCTSLTLTVPAGTFAPGSYPLTVRNPPPVDCQSSDVYTLVVAPPPTITSVAPTAVCAGAASVTVSGTGFEPQASVTMNGLDAQAVTISDGGTTAVAAFPAGIPVGGPFPVTLSNADGCSATSTTTVTVIPGPQIFFVDPSVVYNGITVQATVYGAGFTGTVQRVQLTPSAGGTPIDLVFSSDPTRTNQVQVVIPAGTLAGDYDLSLNDATSCPATLLHAVKVVDQVTLTLAAPPMIPAFGWQGQNTAVSVVGSGFLPVPRLYLNPVSPSSTTVATPVGAVSFLDAQKLTALVPSKSLPVGAYDLIVVNPDGNVGYAANAFSVTQNPPPSIASLSPGSVPNSNPATFSISGADFRNPLVSLRCVDSSGAALSTNPTATLGTVTATSIGVSFDASTGAVACVVRVTDQNVTGPATYADFSALVITNPAQNLYAADAGPDLNIARRGPVALPGDATAAARFLHVVGGDDGGDVLRSVESTTLDLFGAPGSFFIQRNALNQPRTLAGGAQVGRFLYVVGGNDGGAALDTVERAAVLDPNLREEVTDVRLDVSRTSGLDAGVWYYRVASVMGPSDPFNPGGENLPSDPFPVQLPALSADRFDVTVSWKTDPGAAAYRVYRSSSAGATVGTEQVIAEVTAPTTSFKDTGVTTPLSPDFPLPIGSLGTWQTLTPRLSVPREGAGVAFAVDPSNASRGYLYVIGGRKDAATALSSYEFLDLTFGSDGSQAVGQFTAGTNPLTAARWQLQASAATHALSSAIPAGQSYIYALSGVGASGSVVSAADAALVQAGGQLASWTALQTLGRAGYSSVVAGNFVYVFGGMNATPDTSIVSGEICGPGVNGCGPVASQVPPKVANWNAGQSMTTPRYLMGGALSGAFIYTVGGVSSAAPLTVTRSTEFRLW